MSDDASFSNYPSSYGEKNTRKSHFITIFFAILFAVVVLLVGLYFLGAYRKNQLQQGAPSNTSISTTKPTTTPAPSVMPTATPVALERKKLEITILNGSGVAGAAGDISTKLKKLGYTIKSTGNASKFDYTGVTIFITEENKAYLDMLKKDLVDEDATIEATVDGKIKADAEVIVGK